MKSIFNELFPVDEPLSNAHKPPSVPPVAVLGEDLQSNTPTKLSLWNKLGLRADTRIGEFSRGVFGDIQRAPSSVPGVEALGGNDVSPPKGDGELHVLVLTNVSKSLLESDFFRIGPQGKHLEGWNGSIKKSKYPGCLFTLSSANIWLLAVIQARDPNTFEPLDRFFILFNSAHAAEAYSNEAQRLYRLAMQQRRARKGLWGAFLAPMSRNSSDATRVAIRSFTLAPPGRSRLQLKARDARSTIVQQLGKGSLFEKLRQSAKSAHLVLLSIQGGRLDPEALKELVYLDGRERNLEWSLRHCEPLGTDQGHRMAPNYGNESPGNLSIDEYQKDMEENERTTGLKGYSRFILSFGDAPEAKRFVRNWHRRQLPASNWGDHRIVNASIIW
jgi:hypothetical protein